MPQHTTTADFDAIEGWIIDADGVLYRDTEVIPGAAEFIAELTAEGTPFVVLTNNSSRTPAQYAAKLSEMGVRLAEDRVLTSGQATADYLHRRGASAPIFVIGEAGIREPLCQAGFTLTSNWREARYVVVGLDRQITYRLLTEAGLAVRHGAEFIGTNSDRTLPTPDGQVPGNGAILAALEAATDVAPYIVGKPRPDIFLWAAAYLGLPAARVACLGDRLETDIEGGHAAGLTTVFVLSGASSADDLARFEPKPHFVYPSIGEVWTAWRGRRHQ